MSEIDGLRQAELLIGDSPAMHRINDQLQKASLTEVPVLITGESGTGKGLVARLLHEMSPRCSRNFLNLSCPAMSSQIFDQKPFENELDPDTKQRAWKAEKTETIERGTLFLDEIGELNPALQSKLLHKLQDFQPTGFVGANERSIDIRLICATNRDLESEIMSGGFRADLFYRINVLRIHLPPLRDRITDVPILMRHFIRLYSRRFGRDPILPSVSFIKTLESYHWPGNVRELENMAKRYVVLGGEEYVLSVMGQSGIQSPPLEAIDLTTPLRVQTKRAVQHLESKIILSVLKAHNWNRRKAARSLDISYRTLLYKIKESGFPRSNKPTVN